MSINKQITLLYVCYKDSEKIWKESRKIQVGNFFLKSGPVVIPCAFRAWTTPNCLNCKAGEEAILLQTIFHCVEILMNVT